MRLLTQLLLVQPNHLYIQLLDGLYELLILQHEPNTDKSGPPSKEDGRLSERINRLELQIGKANQANRELKDRSQHQIETIRDLNAQLKVEKNRAIDVEAQLHAADRDREELGKYRAEGRSTTALNSFHKDLKRESADINAACLRDICDATDCIKQGGLGHIAEGIFKIKEAPTNWEVAKAKSLRQAEERHKGLAD
jgi:chromosome segregation ATPase